jgi:hypothetical protein
MNKKGRSGTVNNRLRRHFDGVATNRPPANSFAVVTAFARWISV